MKAILVDIKGRHAVALTENGEFIKIRSKKGYNVGCEINAPSNTYFITHAIIKAAAVAASFLLVFGAGYGAYSYTLPYSYINIDINPSIEITSNVYDRIINVRALNQDGMNILSDKNFKNSKVSEGIQSMLINAVEKGYLGANSDNAVMFTVSGKNKNKVEQIEKEVKDTAAKQLDAANVDTEIIVEKVALEKHDEAKDLGISPGKLLLIRKLQEVNPDADVNDYKDVPVKDIMKAMIADRKTKNAQDKAGGNQGNNNTRNKRNIEMKNSEASDDKGQKDNKKEDKENNSDKKASGNNGSDGNNKDKNTQDKKNIRDKKNKNASEDINSKDRETRGNNNSFKYNKTKKAREENEDRIEKDEKNKGNDSQDKGAGKGKQNG